MEIRGRAALVALVLGSSSMWFVCGCDEEEAEATGPIVGAMELPIVLRNQDAEPDNPWRIEISPSEMRLDGRKVIDMEDKARVPASERPDHVLPKLKAAMEGAGPRKAATVRMHANIPYETMISVMNTLARGGIGDVAFEVRKGTGAETGWMRLTDWRVEQAQQDSRAFDRGQREWDEVGRAWDEMHEACTKGRHVDCDPKPMVFLEGGQAALTLFARGQAVKISFERFGAPEEESAEEEAPPEDAKPSPTKTAGGKAAAAEPQDEEALPPPDTDAAFTWKFSEATAQDSAVSRTMRPLCGARQCGGTVKAEYLTPAMQTLSLIGAAFPDGAPGPVLVLERPDSK
jgi:biopolymer transport protein ExbD